jgi:hypothetical protein
MHSVAIGLKTIRRAQVIVGRFGFGTSTGGTLSRIVITESSTGIDVNLMTICSRAPAVTESVVSSGEKPMYVARRW